MFLYIRMFLTMGVSLYTSRLILNSLGVQDYGVYSIVGGIVTMFSFFNGAMSAATQRYLAFDIGKEDDELLKKTFNTTLLIHFGIAFLILIFAETVGLWFVNNHLNFPNERMNAVNWVYQFSVIATLIGVVQVPFNALIIAREQMNIFALLSIGDVVLKLLIVFLLLLISYDKLILYSLLVTLVTLIVALTYKVYCNKYFKETKFKVYNDKIYYKELMSYSGWNLFGSFAMVAKGQGVNVLINIFFGPLVNAAMAISNQVYSSLFFFISSFQMASNPQIIKSFATNNKEYNVSLIIRTAKFSFFLIFLLTLPFIFEIDFVLKLWLNIVPPYTAIFTVLILLNGWIESFSSPLMTGIHATGKIKYYQIVIGIVLTLNLPIVYFIFKMGFGPEISFVVSIVMTLFAFAIRLFYINMLIPFFSVKMFLKEVFVKGIIVVSFSVTMPFLIKYYMEPGILQRVFTVVASLVSSSIAIYHIGLAKEEKVFIKNLIKSLVFRLTSMRNK